MKSEFNGNCQACGRLQVRSARGMAKHGYAVEWSMFVGVCPGSGQPAFQESKDLIEGYIARADADAARLRAEAAKWRETGLIDGKAWYHEYVPDLRGRSGYRWNRVTLIEDARYEKYDKSGHYISVRYIATGGRMQGKPERPYSGYDTADSLEDAAKMFNAKYADHLEKIAANHASYANWQRARIKDWKIEPLPRRKVS